MEIKKKFKIKYPKLFLLILIIIFSYWLFSKQEISNFIKNLGSLGYIGVFISGMLFSFGFTAPIATGFFLVIEKQNIILSAIIGGFGAMLSDLLIFRFIKISFKDEFKKLGKEKFNLKIKRFSEKIISKQIKIYLTYIFAGIILASPLPDEVGVILLGGITEIKEKILLMLGFLLNSFGILIILLL
jgi:hypothetical protein